MNKGSRSFDIENEEGIYARNIISWNTETGEEKVILKRKAAKRWNLKITSQVIPKNLLFVSEDCGEIVYYKLNKLEESTD